MVDVAIIGAGPAGCAAALAFRESGLSISLIERDRFPRDKTCGDALPGRTFKYVNQLIPGAQGVFENLDSKRVLDSSVVYVKGRKVLTKKWVLPAVNSPRIDFDNYLFHAVKEHTATNVREGNAVSQIVKKGGQFHILDKKGDPLEESRFVLIASGANARIREDLIGQAVPKSGYGVAVSQYFSGVRVSENQNHLFIPAKQKVPGYFWIFPVGSGHFNVGYGYLAESKNSVRELYRAALKDDPFIARVMTTAKELGPIRGHKLPFPSFSWPLVNEGGMVIGDAAELMDPLLGHGIDKAMLSGIIAAEVTQKAFYRRDFSAQFLSKYERRVENEIYPELVQNGRWLKRLYPMMRVINWF